MAFHLSVDAPEPVGPSMLPNSQCRPDSFLKDAKGSVSADSGASVGSETTYPRQQIGRLAGFLCTM
jgi:hypothetical protein